MTTPNFPSPENRNMLNNEEHREAIQQDTTTIGKDFLASIGPEYLEKYEAVAFCLEYLKQKNVKVVLNAMLPMDSSRREAMWFFQNTAAFIEWENGKASRQSQLNASYDNHMYMLGFINWFVKLCITDSRVNPYAALSRLVADAASWLTTGIPPAHLTEELDREFDEKK